MVVHDVRITVRCTSSYSETPLFQSSELLTPHLLQILGQTTTTVKENLPILLAEKRKEQQVIWQCIMSESQLSVQVATEDLHCSKPLNCGHIITSLLRYRLNM